MASIDRPTIIRSFNDHFFEFLDDMLKVLPNNKSVKTALNSFRLLTDVNKAILVKCWHKFVYMKYKDVIEKGNVEFFFEKDYSADLTRVADSDDVIKMIDNVRTPLSQLSDKNKEHSISYLNNLNQLSYLYNEHTLH